MNMHSFQRRIQDMLQIFTPTTNALMAGRIVNNVLIYMYTDKKIKMKNQQYDIVCFGLSVDESDNKQIKRKTSSFLESQFSASM